MPPRSHRTGGPPSLWRRRAAAALASDRQTPTLARSPGSPARVVTVLDIGAGTGGASLPLAQEGHPVTAVEPNETMLEGLADASRGLARHHHRGSLARFEGAVGHP